MRLLLLLFFLTSVPCMSQETKLISSNKLSANTFLGVDAYNNTYFLKDMVLHKDGPEGNFVFNDFQLGPIASVDFVNPLKVLIFYQETNTVLFLDNKLSVIERIAFNTLEEFVNVSHASNAGNNTIWIFNIDSQQLELYNYRSGIKTSVSQPFTGQLTSLVSDFNYCFTLTENKLRAFNVYGSLLTESDSNGYETIALHNKTLLALKENELYLLDSILAYEQEDRLEEKKMELSEITIKDLHLTQDFLYIYDGNLLHTFSITPH